MAIIVSDYQQKGRRAKMPVSEKQAKPTKLIIIRGIPGSGKSYIAKHLADKLDALHTQLIDPDAIDYDSNDYKSLSAELLLEGVDTKLHPYRYLRALAYRAISAEKAVIWNQAFTHQDLLDRTIKNLQNYATEHHISILIFVIEVSIDIDVAKKRVLNRTACLRLSSYGS